MPDPAHRDYVDRINRAVDHVTRNLAEPLKLDDVARAACFSPYPLDQCRYDVGVEVPATTVADGEVSVAGFPPCRIAEIDIAGPIELEMRALDWLYRSWLPASGYAPAHLPGFEAWNGRPFAHGMEHFEVRLQLPVVDASLPL